jgi:hypothetical protein
MKTTIISSYQDPLYKIIYLFFGECVEHLLGLKSFVQKRKIHIIGKEILLWYT